MSHYYAHLNLDEQGIKDYIVGGKTYRVKRCYEWYNDESSCEWYLYPEGCLEFGYFDSGEFYETGQEITRVQLAARFYSEDEEAHKFPTQLEVSAALVEDDKYEFTPREEAEWTLITAKEKQNKLKEQLQWAQFRLERAKRDVETAAERAKDELNFAQQEHDKLVTTLANQEVKVADAYVLMQNDTVG